MRPVSSDIRDHILASVANGESRASIARRFRISRQTVYNVIRRNAVAPGGDPSGPVPEATPQGKLSPGILCLLRAWVEEDSTLTLKEIQARLRDEFGISVSHVAIWKRLRSMDQLRRRTKTASQHANAS